MVSGDLTRYALSMQCLMGLKAPAGSVGVDGDPENSVLTWNCGVLIARSINTGFQAVLDNPKLQWAWIMGDDHTYEPDIILKLLEHEKDAIVPLCLNRMPPLDPTIVEHDHQPTGRMKYLEDLPDGGLYKLRPEETCGDAGLLIRRNVLEAIGSDWYERKKSGAHAAEDQEFIQRVKDAGFDVWVDLDTVLGHIGHVNFLPFRKDGQWHIRMMGGGARHLADMRPAARTATPFIA
ncbi:MAG: hypothetical protein NUV72_02305 [Bauldia sp.]|nr:hypothetical protein [Bauldia sp.]